MSHRLVSGGGWLVEILLFLLYYRISHPAGRAAGSIHLRLYVPVRVVSGAAAQNSDKKIHNKKAEGTDLHKIRRSSYHGSFAAGTRCE